MMIQEVTYVEEKPGIDSFDDCIPGAAVPVFADDDLRTTGYAG